MHKLQFYDMSNMMQVKWQHCLKTITSSYFANSMNVFSKLLHLSLNPLGPAGVNRDFLYLFLSRTTEWLVWTTIDHPLRVPLQLYERALMLC